MICYNFNNQIPGESLHPWGTLTFNPSFFKWPSFPSYQIFSKIRCFENCHLNEWILKGRIPYTKHCIMLCWHFKLFKNKYYLPYLFYLERMVIFTSLFSSTNSITFNQGREVSILKIIKHWGKKLKTEINGIIFHIYGLEELIFFNIHTAESHLYIQ